MLELDNVIIGGGIVGLISAISLAKLGYKTTIFDIGNTSQKNQDGRILSLSYASYQYLLSIGVYIPVQLLTPIREVHISHNGFGVSRINSSLIMQKELGYTIGYVDLYNTIYQKAKQLNSYIQFIYKQVSSVESYSDHSIINYNSDNSILHNTSIKANHLIMAEGGDLSNHLVKYHTYDYNQIAIISKINCAIHHQNIAHERFDKLGVMALLPYQTSYVLIFVVDNSHHEFVYNQNLYHDYLVQNKFIKKLGRFDFIDDNKYFPLKLKITKNRVINNILLLGSSAQIINPIAAQGLNLSIRDIRVFINLLIKYQRFDFNQLSTDYDIMRGHDINFIKHFTHNLSIMSKNRVFNKFLSLGIVTFDNLHCIKKRLVNSLVFGN